MELFIMEIALFSGLLIILIISQLVQTLNNRETRQRSSTESTKLSDLDIQYENIKSRYMQQFSAMEKAVTSMKSTGEYLTSLFEAMSKDD